MKTFSVCLLAALFSVAFSIHCDPIPGTPVNTPMGDPKGLAPGRVAWFYDPKCCTWDGNNETSFWWEEKNTNYMEVQYMFSELILALHQETRLDSSWDKMFRHFNREKYGEDRGYMEGEKIAVKINLNTLIGAYKDNNGNGLSPQMLKALLKHLVEIVGVKQDDITIYDASRWIAPLYFDGPTGSKHEFPDVHFVDNQGLEGREKVQVGEDTPLYFSSKDVPAYNYTRLPKCATQADYMIVLDNFRGHVMAGLTESGKNFFGSVYRPTAGPEYVCGPAGFWCPMSLHKFANVSARPMGAYNVLVDLLGHPNLGGNAMLFLSDGLYGGPVQDPVDPVRFLSEPFNGNWSSSLFASQDPIALDSVLYDFLRNEPNVPLAHSGCVDNYMHEGAQADNPPSKTVYNPSGKEQLSSLGVHEHWNNAKDKQYSGPKNHGIDLIKVHE